MTDVTTPEFEPQWGIVEVLGHQTFAGLVSQQSMFGAAMCRIDVPEIPAYTQRYGGDVPATAAYTKYIGGGSIYAFTPVDEATARAAARGNSRPVSVYIPEILPAKSAAQIPAPTYSKCVCGHASEDHDGRGGWCVIELCPCEGYTPNDELDGEPLRRIVTTCTCGHAEEEHDPDDGFCEMEDCGCMGYERAQSGSDE